MLQCDTLMLHICGREFQEGEERNETHEEIIKEEESRLFPKGKQFNDKESAHFI